MEDSPDSTSPVRPLRSMQTGQNSNAPEYSLPQLGQVRRSSAFMGRGGEGRGRARLRPSREGNAPSWPLDRHAPRLGRSLSLPCLSHSFPLALTLAVTLALLVTPLRDYICLGRRRGKRSQCRTFRSSA